MKQTTVTALWTSASFSVALGLAAVVLSISGTETASLDRALQVTARFSFLLFWLAYSGGAMKTLFGSGFQPIAWRGRDFGLSFASAHLVHIGLVIWLYQVATQAPVSPPLFWFFGIGVLWIAILSLLSIQRVARAIGHLRWRMLRVCGMEYISFAFLFDFLSHPLHGSMRTFLFYVPFAALSVVGTFLRLAAWASRGATVTTHA